MSNLLNAAGKPPMPTMVRKVSALVLCAAFFGLVHPAEAQERLRRAPNSTVPTLGQTEQERRAPEEAFRAFIGEAHPVWAGMSWTEAMPNLEVLAIRGFPQGADDPPRIAPEFVATQVTVEIPFKNSTLTARRAYLLDGYLVFRDFSLKNDSGQMEAEFAVLSQDAMTIIGQYLEDQRPDPDEPKLAGEIVLNRAIAVSQEFAGDRPDRGFASTVSADLLGFSGMSWGDGEDAPVIVSGMKGAGLSGSARFSGTAEFSLAEIGFMGSIPDLTRALMQRLEPAEPVAETAAIRTKPTSQAEAEAEAGPGAEAENRASSETDAEAESDTESVTDADAEAAVPAPATVRVVHPFALDFSDLSYSAARANEEPATVAARAGAVRGTIEENGVIQVAARLADMRASPSVFAGTPLEEIAQQMAVQAEQPHLSLDFAIEAALSSDRLRLNIPCITMPGLADFSTELDVAIPGLERMLTASPGGRSGGALDLLFASQARALAIQLVDDGLNAVLTASGAAPLGELVQSTLLSRLQGQEGMRMMMLQTALAPVTSILSQFDKDGSVALAARFDEETSLPVALVGFLQSAEPVQNGAADAARCEAVSMAE